MNFLRGWGGGVCGCSGFRVSRWACWLCFVGGRVKAFRKVLEGVFRWLDMHEFELGIRLGSLLVRFSLKFG